MEICFASGNPNKVLEINKIFPENIYIYGLNRLEINADIPETGSSLEENAFLKAEYVYQRNQLAVFADDSGLFVNAIDGAPGIYSARYAGKQKNDKKNIEKLLKELASFEDRSAYFATVIAFIDEEGNRYSFEGRINGAIANSERGSNGFGYDPIFIPTGYEQTFAELDSKVKNSISHRFIAVQKLLEHLLNTNQ